jgi:hypothetical protein
MSYSPKGRRRIGPCGVLPLRFCRQTVWLARLASKPTDIGVRIRGIDVDDRMIALLVEL